MATTAAEALAYSIAAARDIARARANPNSVVKLAVVLSPPVPLSSADARQLYGDSEDPVNQALGAATSNRRGRFLFKARVLSDGPQAWNPHERIENPCNLSTTATLDDAIELVRLHTTFISPMGYNGEVPKVGDFIKVRFHQIRQPGSPKGSWNTAQGDFIELADAGAEAAASSANTEEQCTNLGRSFANNQLIGNASGLAAAVGSTAPPSPAATSDSTIQKPEIVKACEAKGHIMYDDGKVNLIGVRAQELRSSNQFVDRFFIVWKEGGKWESRGYPITTKPGLNILRNPKWGQTPGVYGGAGNTAAILKPGQYVAYQIDAHGNLPNAGTEQPLRDGSPSPLSLGPNSGYMALCQRAANVTCYRDGNRDDNIDAEQSSNPAAETSGKYGINIHRAWRGSRPSDTEKF